MRFVAAFQNDPTLGTVTVVVLTRVTVLLFNKVLLTVFAVLVTVLLLGQQGLAPGFPAPTGETETPAGQVWQIFNARKELNSWGDVLAERSSSLAVVLTETDSFSRFRRASFGGSA